eukprot:15447257-Alexandrium_andersonii.AAC.2
MALVMVNGGRLRLLKIRKSAIRKSANPQSAQPFAIGAREPRISRRLGPDREPRFAAASRDPLG